MPSSDIYRDILENIHDGIYFVDRERRITYWNKGAERITGYSAEEVVGSFCSNNILVHVDALGLQLCKSACPLTATMGDGSPLRPKSIFITSWGTPAGVGADLSAARCGWRLHWSGGNVQRHQLAPEPSGASGGAEKAGAVGPPDGAAESPPPGGYLHSRLRNCGAAESDSVCFSWTSTISSSSTTSTGTTSATKYSPSWPTLFIFHPALRHGVPLGGEEFAGIFPHVDVEVFHGIAERLRVLVAHSQANTGIGVLTVTLSIGGSLAKPEDSAASLLQRADRLMYASKINGRNRVTIEEG